MESEGSFGPRFGGEHAKVQPQKRAVRESLHYVQLAASLFSHSCEARQAASTISPTHWTTAELPQNAVDASAVDAYDLQLSHPNLPKKASRDPGQSSLPLQPPVAAPQQNSTFSLKEVKKLFKTGGHNFDRVIPAQVRQQLSKDCAGG